MAQTKIDQIRQEIEEIHASNELASLKQNKIRARSICVGTAGGGILELSMRGDYSDLWYQMQPIEAVEFIGQLAAACGVEIAMRPRQDFASWRSWDVSLPPSITWMGAAPWQLGDEMREELLALKAKNIKAIKGDDEPESKSKSTK